MKWQAQWIWHKCYSGNSYVLFRKEFQLPPGVKKGQVRISADSRYILYLNGQRLGQGPARSWPWQQEYDLYDVGSELLAGTNVLAVMVNYFGVSTFHYLAGPPGLICQLDWEGDNSQGTVATDTSWKTKTAAAYDKLSPRISCQLPYTEIYDARKEEAGWLEADFEDSSWEAAILATDEERSPAELHQRSITFLTEEPVYPVGVLEKRIIAPPPHFWTVDVREIFIPQDRTANRFQLTGLLVGIIEAPRKYTAKLWYYANSGFPYLNGEKLALEQPQLGAAGQMVEVELAAGENILCLDLRDEWHTPTVTVGLEGEGLTLHSPLNNKDPMAVFAGNAESLLAIQKVVELESYYSVFKPLPDFAQKSVDVTALTTSVRTLSDSVEGNVERLGFPTFEGTVIEPSPKGDLEFLIDFGKEIVGFLEFQLAGPAGVVLDWNFFEGIQDGNRVYTPGLKNTLRYITSGRGRECFHSHLRRGFRYASLTIRNLQAPLTIYQLRCLLNTYPVVARGNFTSSDFLLNKIWEMSAYTTRLCMEDVFVDCPAYEQTFWVGDSRNEALINYYTFGELQLPKRCWDLVAESLKRSKLPESQVPSGWQDIIPAWSLLWVIACEEYYLYSGDENYLEEIYPALATTCRNFLAYKNKKGLLEIEAWNLLDWAPMDTPRQGVVTHQNAWLVEALRRTAKVAELLKREQEAAEFRQQADALAAAINTHLWSEEKQAYIDCIHADGTPSEVVSQQTNTVVYLCNVADFLREEIIANYIHQVPEGWTRAGSPFMLFFIFEALAKQGEYQRILELTRTGWGMMLKHGSTTCWETFPGFWDSLWTRSYCHAWSAGPAYFLSAYQLGVRPQAPGFKKALIAPELCDLTWCRGQVPTPFGEIQVAWQNEKDFFLEINLPKEVEAEVILPIASTEYEVTDENKKNLYVLDGRWHLELPKGKQCKIQARRIKE